MKLKKGQYGYHARLKIQTACWTLLLFAVSAAIFFAGVSQSGTKNNLFTVFAILGCLPASKSAVHMIMAFRIKGCTKEAAEAFAPFAQKVFLLYDLYMTSEKKNFDIACMAVGGQFLCGFAQNPKTDIAAAGAHIQHMLNMRGKSSVPVKILANKDAFLNCLSSMAKAGTDEESLSKIEEMADFVKSLSL